jgi:hypothetical protein
MVCVGMIASRQHTVRRAYHLSYMIASIADVAENESKNLQVSIDRLGDTVTLIGDFESVYDGLPPIITLPAGGAENDEAMAVTVVIHLMVFCRRQVTMGCLTPSVMGTKRRTDDRQSKRQ